MERVRSEEVAARVGQRVRVVGWLQSLRRLGAISFLAVRDGTGVVQAIVDQARLAPLAAAQAESVIAVTGEVCAEPQAPGGVGGGVRTRPGYRCHLFTIVIRWPAA